MIKLKKHIKNNIAMSIFWVYGSLLVILNMFSRYLNLEYVVITTAVIILGAMALYAEYIINLVKTEEAAKYDITVKTQRDSGSSLAHVDNAQEHP